MNWIATLCGAVAGGLLFEQGHGLLLGALFGWLISSILQLRERVRILEGRPVDERRSAVAPALQPAPPAADNGDFIFLPKEAPLPATPSPPPRATRPLPPRPPLPDKTAPQRAPRLPLPEPWRWLFSGENLLVKTGMVILFFGVAFLVKYAAQRGLVPVQLRLGGAALGGSALLYLGWRLRTKRREYALTLQGGGIGILYITVYAALRLYGLLDPRLTLILLALIAAGSGLLAVSQNALTLALFAVVGGFLAPLLAPSGGGPTLLFGYYLILNLGIAAIAWSRSWRVLNLTGFFATFVIGLWWGGKYYRPAFFGSVEPFLIAFFLLYVVIATLFAWRQPPGTRGIVDGTLVFGTPLIAFALQSLLVADWRYGLAWSAFAGGLFYLGWAGLMRRRLPELSSVFGIFGVLFLTLAIPLACDGRWTSAFWAIEGAAILWAALRRERSLAAAFGIVLQFAAGVAFLRDLDHAAALIPLFNALWFGTVLMSVAALGSAWLLRSGRGAICRFGLDRLLTAWGLLWWLGGGLREIERFVSPPQRPLLTILLLSGTAIVCHLGGRRLRWSDLANSALLLLPALVLSALLTGALHPAAHGGWWGWPLALATLWLILYDDEALLSAPLRIALHSGTLCFFTALTTWELLWQVQERVGSTGSWRELAIIAFPCLVLAAITRLSRSTLWPCGRERLACLGVAGLPLAILIWLWVIVSTNNPADSWPFPWLPLVNPLDLGVIVTLATLTGWWQGVQRCAEVAPFALPLLRPVRYLSGATLFLWLNAVLARGLSHWRHLPYAFDPLFHSTFVQTAFSLFWSLLALGAMFYAVRRALRPLWLVGAGLLVAVVGKLFLIDLAGHGTIERIVSFVVVGLLLLVIGWFAPVPPENGGPVQNSDASPGDS